MRPQRTRPPAPALVLFVLCAALLPIGSARAGGMEYNHYWSFEIAGVHVILAEIKSGSRPGKPFTRLRIHDRGRDFQCRIWTFVTLIGASGLVGLAGVTALFHRRQRDRES